MKKPIAIKITHVNVDDENHVIEVGAMNDSNENWRSSEAEAIALYRNGVRFFMTRDGQDHEIVVEDRDMEMPPRLRCSSDTCFMHSMATLPRFPVA